MRRPLLIAAAIVVFLAAAWTAYWLVMADRAGDWVAHWAAPAPGKAWHGRFAAAETTGYPFSLDVRLAEPVVTWQGGSGGGVWQGPWLVASFRPWSLARFDIALPEEQHVTFDDGTLPHMVVLTMAEGHARVEIADNRARAVRFEAVDIAATWAPGRPPVAAGRADVLVEATPDHVDSWDLALRLQNVRFPAEAPPPFGGTVPLLETDLRLSGPLPEGPIEQGLAAWRDAGGMIDVLALRLAWPPLDIRGEGALALDREMRPLGAFTAEIVGYREMIEAFEALGRLTRSQATVAAAALDAMATADGEGERRLSVPLSMQNGKLFAGPILIGDLPPVIPAGGAD